MNTENTRSKPGDDKMTMTAGANEVGTLNSFVREQVIRTLGQPPDLLSVQVKSLWETSYRVNVFVGASNACAQVSHSFFLVTDGDGNILSSTPKIERHYGSNSL